MQTPAVEPPRILPETVDRRLYRMIHRLPHSTVGDRYVTTISDLGEGLGWVTAGVAVAWLGGPKGLIKPVFRRKRPHVGRDVVVVGIRTTDASFPSGHSASSFAAATATAAFYPKVAPLVFALAAGVGISRVHLGHHFPSDVAAGGLIGIASGTIIAGLLKVPESI